MWSKKSKNMYSLNLTNIKKKISADKEINLPNLKDEFINLKTNKYNFIENSSNSNISTIHAINKEYKAAITIFENHLEAFIMNKNGNYSIKMNKDSVYEIKESIKEEKSNEKENKGTDRCKVLSVNEKDNENNDCGCNNKRGKKKMKNRSQLLNTATDFTHGDVIKSYSILYGLDTEYKLLYNNDQCYQRLLHLNNIVNMIYQNNFACYFTIDETKQQYIIEHFSDYELPITDDDGNQQILTIYDDNGDPNLYYFTQFFDNILGVAVANPNINITDINYDIGHVLRGSTSVYGVAYLYSLCSSLKGGGFTSGTTITTTDSIQVLCHEIGHQFGCNHIHQKCNNTTTTNFEPGSGSTIMSYAGICPPNVQNDADLYFNRYNVYEGKTHMENITCGSSTSNVNQVIPTINNTYDPNIYYIPDNIPFELYADNVTGINDENDIFYSWEGTNLGNGAIIRSKMLRTPYRTISNTVTWDRLLELEEILINVKKIRLINGWSTSSNCGWTGNFTVSNDNNVSSGNSFDFSNTNGGDQSSYIELDTIIENATSINFNFTNFNPTDATFVSDLIVFLLDENNQNILYFGGYNIEISDTPLNNNTWDNSLATNQPGTYDDTIALELPEQASKYSFQLTIRSSKYNTLDTNTDSTDLIDYQPDYFSVIASKLLYNVLPLNTDGNLQITISETVGNIITLEWDPVNTAQSPFNASDVSIYICKEGEIWTYNSDHLLYTGQNIKSPIEIVINDNYFQVNFKLKIKFSNNLFILETENLYIENAPPIITLLGTKKVIHKLNTPYEDAGATANDYEGVGITDNIIVDNQVDTSIEGEYIVTYNVIDSDGLEAIEIIRTVIVEEFIEIFDQEYPRLSTTEIVLFRNQLTGEIPSDIGRFENLLILDISSNELTGEIPNQIKNLTNLEWLNIGSNKLTGKIPTKISNLTKLLLIDLSNNELTDEIPTNISNLTKLNYLNLRNNKLTGEVPNSLFDKLEYMYLSDNQLTGSIQTVNFESPDLAKVISLSNNNLTGEIPLALNEMDLSGLNIDLRYNSFTNSSSIFEYSELLKINPQTPFENTLLKHKDLDQITWVNKDLFKFKKWLSNGVNLDDLYED